MKFSETMDYYLSRNLKESDSYSLLKARLEKFPYDFFKLVKFTDKSYKESNQGAKINYKVNPNRPRENTVIIDVNDGFKNRKIIMEIRRSGNEVNLITKTRREDTKIFHIRYLVDDTVNVIDRTVRFYDTDNEQEVNLLLAKFDKEGNLLDFIEKHEEFYGFSSIKKGKEKGKRQ